ncbi:hypothetical protein VNO78_30814 [Psophocarpus tetragonolobus]|uniref:Uncharacterized protein n=1 Tax=Psophocarpus tetragonolobus TaxID=3891 RepID=A0AAN9RXD0_PSOTE
MYNFSTTHLQSFPNTTLPLALDWTVGDKNCSSIDKNGGDYACKNNARCDDKDSDYGYRCICKDGYQGNPYLGCTDIDECMTAKHTCISHKNCENTDGNYTCFCRTWQSGNGRREGGCNVHPLVIVGAVVGFVILFLGSVIPYIIYQKRKLNKLRKKHFQQNGGLLLLQELQTKNHSNILRIFGEEELQEATLDFDKINIIDEKGSGTVFKGYIYDNDKKTGKKTVAIKKSKIVVDNKISNLKQQFINEIIVLSGINHKNLVKLLGCCLDTQVPLLVYEFVNNGTLFDFIHKRKVHDTTWTTRLKIAAEVAGALFYLHSQAAQPIIHRNVKTSNILLDDNDTAKLSNFGASTFTTLDQNESSTISQETGDIYLDPEYKEKHQFTEKSDVYSFGIVLVELLTGQQKKEHADHILSSSKENLLEVVQEGLLNEKNKEQIEKVAILAAKCLNRIGKERPSMKVVVTELDKITSISTDPNLMEPKPNYERGDSSSHKKGNDSIEGQVPATLNYGR